ERDDLAHGEPALGEDVEHLPPDIAGGSDDGDTIGHGSILYPLPPRRAVGRRLQRHGPFPVGEPGESVRGLWRFCLWARLRCRPDRGSGAMSARLSGSRRSLARGALSSSGGGVLTP